MKCKNYRKNTISFLMSLIKSPGDKRLFLKNTWTKFEWRNHENVPFLNNRLLDCKNVLIFIHFFRLDLNIDWIDQQQQNMKSIIPNMDSIRLIEIDKNAITNFFFFNSFDRISIFGMWIVLITLFFRFLFFVIAGIWME